MTGGLHFPVGRVICPMTPGRGPHSVADMKLIITAGIAAAAAVAAIATSASGQSSSTPATLHFVQRDAHFGFVDAPPKQGTRKPPSLGDEFVIDGRLSQAGKAAGADGLVCTVTTPGAKEVSNCVGTASLANGTITVAGVSRAVSNGDTFAVTGGTGDYASARGTVVTKQGAHNTTLITINLAQ